MIILALVMVSATAQMVSANAGRQTWYLSSDHTTGNNNTMYKGSQSGGTSGVKIYSGNSVIWVANQSAQCDVGFARGNWNGRLKKPWRTRSKPFNVAIGVWDGSSFTSYGNMDGDFGGGKDNAFFTILASQFDVLEGQYLAFNVTNTGSRNFTIVTKCGLSHVKSPCSDPGYPVPELPTLVLVSAGLLMLVGYVYMGRRNK
ncbi:MAG: hypothetical protein GWP10_18345 [Nitrospiraceae bacterium]|nr:hypothetical protein [Nitrospiraceae bacterium]